MRISVPLLAVLAFTTACGRGGPSGRADAAPDVAPAPLPPPTVDAGSPPPPPQDAGLADRIVAPLPSLAPLVARIRPSVVNIIAELQVAQRVWGPYGRYSYVPRTVSNSLGSGFIVDAEGRILTNAHVIGRANVISVQLDDGREIPAKLVGRDPRVDLAVLDIDVEGLHPLELGDSDKVRVGDYVVAVGNPFGLGETVTTGIVSALGRVMPGDGAGTFNYQDYIQTDAAINPGNSGGALVDMQGRLIGLNTAIFSRDGGFMGIGFAIPSDMARSIMNSLVRTGKVVRGYLGVTIQDLSSELAEQFHLKSSKGAIVTDVTADSPAAKAGLKSDDVVLEYNGKPVSDSRGLSFAVAATEPGREAPMNILRDGKAETITIKVGEQPGDRQLASAASAEGDHSVLNGVEVTDLDAASRNEFDVPSRVHGALVTDVDSSSAAAEAGLAPGDVIMEINHQPVRSADDAVHLTEHAPSRKTLLKLWTHGGIHFLVVDETNDKGS